MRKRRAGRVRRTEQQWTEILQRLGSGGEDSREFCRREGVALSSLQRWRRRLGTAHAARFVELVPPTGTAEVAGTWSLEVSLPNGISLRIRG
jgi:hypothetical protein